MSIKKENVMERLAALYQDGRSLPGLASIKRLLKALGNPQEHIKCVHVAGTNGKGSTCAYIERILREAGYETGLFVSPHIERLTEYIRLNGKEVGSTKLSQYVERVLDASEVIVAQGHEHPTFFEVITACAFLCFAEREVDVAIIEAGLGGRLDATNVIVPVVSVITQIGLDHVAVLGAGVDKIAKEKAGIIKPGVPVVLARQQFTLPQMVIKSVCRDLGTTCTDAEDCHFEIAETSLTSQRFYVDLGGESFDAVISLGGAHQVDNAITALFAARVLRSCGYVISHEAMLSGLREAGWDGRMQVCQKNGLQIILDGAHNPQAARALSQAVKEHLKDQKIILVCGILNTKDALNMAKEFASFAEKAICTMPMDERAMPSEELLELFGQVGKGGEAVNDVKEAMIRANVLAKERDAHWIVVTGSLYMLGQVQQWIQEN